MRNATQWTRMAWSIIRRVRLLVSSCAAGERSAGRGSASGRRYGAASAGNDINSIDSLTRLLAIMEDGSAVLARANPLVLSAAASSLLADRNGRPSNVASSGLRPPVGLRDSQRPWVCRGSAIKLPELSSGVRPLAGSMNRWWAPAQGLAGCGMSEFKDTTGDSCGKAEMRTGCLSV